ncbi:MAG: ion transporter [Gammaproteobacteria bacterium]|nr:MAG: ion transporter [Gammaproteobacteria bacterium]
MLLIILVNCLVVALVVIIHYEALLLLSDMIPKLTISHRLRLVLGVLGALLAHTIEVWVFAIVYYYMNGVEKWGYLHGSFDNSLLDCVYYSFTTYTTLGFGDIEPIGAIRYLTGVEALTGLVLITWSASFLFIEMQRYWKIK